MAITDKLKEIKERYKEIIESLQKPDVINDREKLIELSKEKKKLESIIEPYDKYLRANQKINEDRKLIQETDDSEMIELAREEIEVLQQKKVNLEKKIKNAMIPDDPESDKNAVLEIRAGTGGDEAALFAADLLRMYSKYCEKMGWKIEIADYSRTDMNGYKEAIALISGDGVYGRLKFESGVHRVQRVPETESGGRIHTSAVSVAVLPEREEVEVEIDPGDLEVDFYSASGPGGQHVNRASTAVRLEHKPTGIVVTCQDERSQHQNRVKAMKLLRTKLYEQEKSRKEKERKSQRKQMIGTGDRSEKIRTYNFPQNRVSDHRINYKIYNLESVMDGELDDLLDSLIQAEREKLYDEIT